MATEEAKCEARINGQEPSEACVHDDVSYPGLTKRERMALEFTKQLLPMTPNLSCEQTADLARHQADALLEELAATEGGA